VNLNGHPNRIAHRFVIPRIGNPGTVFNHLFSFEKSPNHIHDFRIQNGMWAVQHIIPDGMVPQFGLVINEEIVQLKMVQKAFGQQGRGNQLRRNHPKVDVVHVGLGKPNIGVRILGKARFGKKSWEFVSAVMVRFKIFTNSKQILAPF
jgi:hypothetical protein